MDQRLVFKGRDLAIACQHAKVVDPFQDDQVADTGQREHVVI